MEKFNRFIQVIFYIIVILYGIALVLHDINMVGFNVEDVVPSTYVIILTVAVASYSAVSNKKDNWHEKRD